MNFSAIVTAFPFSQSCVYQLSSFSTAVGAQFHAHFLRDTTLDDEKDHAS
jgi:hypothetical protein